MPVFAISPTTFYNRVRRHGGPTDAELADAYAVNGLHQAWVEHRRRRGKYGKKDRPARVDGDRTGPKELEDRTGGGAKPRGIG